MNQVIERSNGRMSVVVPAFNAAPYISTALKALLSQTYSDIEIIVVDDGSTDSTSDVVLSFGRSVKLITHGSCRGVSHARNTGASNAQGDWLAFLDADDWWPPEFVEQAIALVKPGEALCYDNILVETEASAVGASNVSSSIQTLHARAHSWRHRLVTRENVAAMFDGAPILKSIVHRADFAASGGFDPRFRIGEDFHYHVKLLSKGIALRLVDRPCGFYRVHAGQATAAISPVRGQAENVQRLQACKGWLTMFNAMPVELTLDDASIQACQKAAKYWRYRYLKGAMLLGLEHFDWKYMRGADFWQSMADATEVVLRSGYQRLKRSPR